MVQLDGIVDYREPEWVAEKLGLDKNTVYRYLQEGALPGVQLGRKWLVSERLLAEHLERETRRQTQMRGAMRTGGGAATSREGLPKTPRLQKSMQRARQLAQREGASAVGTEHALIGVAEVPDGLGAVVLTHLGITAEKLRELRAAHPVAQAPGSPLPDPDLLDPVNRAYELAVEEAMGMGHNYLGGEHLLLGILREESGLGGRMLQSLGLTYDVARKEVLKRVRGIE